MGCSRHEVLVPERASPQRLHRRIRCHPKEFLQNRRTSSSNPPDQAVLVRSRLDSTGLVSPVRLLELLLKKRHLLFGSQGLGRHLSTWSRLSQTRPLRPRIRLVPGGTLGFFGIGSDGLRLARWVDDVTNVRSKRSRRCHCAQAPITLGQVSLRILLLPFLLLIPLSMSAQQAFPQTEPGVFEIKTLPAGTLLKSGGTGNYFRDANGLFMPLSAISHRTRSR